MTLRVAINGFGRIGRAFFRRALGERGIEIAAINDPSGLEIAAHLLHYDSVAGPYRGRIDHNDTMLRVNGKTIPFFCRKDPAELPWRPEGIDLVLEASGIFTARSDAARHLEAGAGMVIITAPSPESDLTVVMGVNHDEFHPGRHRIVSNASCTTNCMAPLLSVIDGAFGIEHGFFTTVHSYTNGQALLDQPHEDLRRARAGALNMIPTTTGVLRALYHVLPGLKGRIDGMSIRVPVPNVSLVDLVLTVGRETDAGEVNRSLERASRGRLRGIIACTEEELVSADYRGNEHSAVVDSLLTAVIGGNMVRVVAWYDNEAAFARRLVELVRLAGKASVR
ncbi:MAG TPA: type I glyceraldehyde-3-phosphate dehydrogenase [Geobacteraceae bacterium]|nr:type I glyceraldehyde-3-phosphate dehydrogenase [Geobacteraceae bacterium]